MRVADIFCGAGGFSDGFRRASADIVCGVDSDPDACETYRTNFKNAVTIWGDVRQDFVRAQVLEASQDADIVVGGPPCQAFSQVRNHDRLLEDPRNALYREFVRVLEHLRPRAFAMENVPGLRQLRLQELVAGHLCLDGEYDVTVHTPDACDFGVPQTRKRLVFLGVHKSFSVEPPLLVGTGASKALTLQRRRDNGLASYRPSTRTLFDQTLGERLSDPSNLELVSAEQAIGDLAHLRRGRRSDTVAVDELPPATSAYQVRARRFLNGILENVSVPRMNADTEIRLSAIPAGGNYLDLSEELKQRYLTGQRWGPENGSGRLGRRHYYAYRKLHPNFWAWTLNTKADSAYHWFNERALSVREFARLQSFDDNFVFTTSPEKGPLRGRSPGGPAHSRYRQVGNAVPPLLAHAIAQALLAAAGGSKRLSDSP